MSTMTPEQLVGPLTIELLEENGYIVSRAEDIVCMAHDGVPMTEEEEAEMEDGYDPCILVVRIWT